MWCVMAEWSNAVDLSSGISDCVGLSPGLEIYVLKLDMNEFL